MRRRNARTVAAGAADVPWIEADWPAAAGVRALSTLRHGAGISTTPFDRLNLGNHRGPDGDDPPSVARNRATLADLAALPSSPRWLRQVHGTAVVRRGIADAAGAEPEADAAITTETGVVLAILTADCLPVVLAADDGTVLGAAHAGWRGLAGGVLEACVAAMAGAGADRGGIVAWLGPAAGPGAYEVGAEVRDAFRARDPDAAHAFRPTRPGHWCMDLFALARGRLAAAGVRVVHGGGHCTISAPDRFFSHRRDGRTGRMATLLWRDRD